MILGREAKAQRIVDDGRVRRTVDEEVEYRVEGDRGIEYIVTHFRLPNTFACTCPDYVYREHECKHIKAVKKDIAQENSAKLQNRGRYERMVFSVHTGNQAIVNKIMDGLEEADLIEDYGDFDGYEYGT